MLRKIRTYNSVYRLLAITFFVASVLSLIDHACMMDEAHAGPMIKKCCCKEGHADHAKGHTRHEDNGHHDHEAAGHADHADTGHHDHENQHTVHHEHDGMQAMDAYEECDEDTDAHTHPSDQHLPNDCCSTDIYTLASDTKARIKAPTLHKLLAYNVVFSELPVLPRKNATAALFRDLGPPPLSSPPTHILFAQFLN